MEAESLSDELSSFLDSVIHHLDGPDAIFIDPVRVLSRSYSRVTVSPSAYYSRTFESAAVTAGGGDDPFASRTRKRSKKRPHELNERERSAEQRHQKARPFLLRAHEALLGSTGLLSVLSDIVRGETLKFDGSGNEQDFIELGSGWRAPFYELSLFFGMNKGQGSCHDHGGPSVVPLFNNLISNESCEDADAEFLNNFYILPKRSCFHMSDLKQIKNLIPGRPDDGFNLIVIDPPWENGSAYQKAMYPTLPNRYYLYLPIKELAHREGALVALWTTNREKLRVFIENELFPTWGVTGVTQWYWLKVKPDGSLIGELDLFHHRPYECVLLGYINGEDPECICPTTFDHLRNNQVIISIPGAHSRKPPLKKLLSDHIPGSNPARCIELFAREMVGGWTSWGNEPLRFQDSRYFVQKEYVNGEV